jgi:hypothetical protein
MPCENIVKYLYNDTESSLKIPTPKFILSIIGGTGNFRIDRETENAFKTGLMKVAKINDTWIITGAINTGVVKVVGEAVDEDLNSKHLIVLGITSRNRIYGSYSELKRAGEIVSDENTECLNSHHSSFIFVDTQNQTNEIQFRNNLEKHLQKSLQIPFFLIVVNGGYNTLKTISDVLKHNMSVILVAVSTLVSHFFLFTCSFSSINTVWS